MKHLNLSLLFGRPLALLWLGPLAARAQAPAWQAALSGNNNQLGSGSSATGATATDAAGNVFITGNISGRRWSNLR